MDMPVANDVAMTGEITLRGRVLPIGGLKEKVMAAHRAGITKVLIPSEKVQDIKDFLKTVLKEVELVPIEHLDDVLAHALQLPEGRESVFQFDKHEGQLPMLVQKNSDDEGDITTH
jgi:ATP-dependent Lon protease